LDLLLTACPSTGPASLSLHDALPISTVDAFPRRLWWSRRRRGSGATNVAGGTTRASGATGQRARVARVLDNRRWPREPAAHANPDRKSTRLNSSHVKISYAGFCLKKK